MDTQEAANYPAGYVPNARPQKQQQQQQQSQPGTITGMQAWYQQVCVDGGPPHRSSS